MKEELYIIVNSERVPLDLNTPSGITLNYASNMFKDLGKISSSYSYTFKLPMTHQNSRAFDMAEDLRHASTAVRKKLSAEYYMNGFNVLGKANLYIDAVEGGYSCVLTWGVIEGLVAMNEDDKSIRDLFGDLDASHYQGGLIYYAQHTPSYSVTSSSQQGLVWTNTDQGLQPTYEAGIPYVDRWARAYHGSTAVESSNYHEYIGDDYSSEQEGYRGNVSPAPLPVINLRWLLNKIREKYNVGLDFYTGVSAWTFEDLMMGVDTDDNEDPSETYHHPTEEQHTYNLLNAGVVPLVTAESSELSKKTALRIVKNGSVPVIRREPFTNGPNILDFGINDMYITNMSYYSDSLMTTPYNTTYQSYAFITLSAPSHIEVSGRIRSSYSSTSTRFTKVALSRVLYNDVDDALVISESDWDMRKEYGGKTQTAYLPAGLYCLRLVDYSSSAAAGINIDLTITIQNEEGESDRYIETYKSLPDMKCIDLLKAIYYAVGAYPIVNAQGQLSLGYYNTLGARKASGDAVDWSDKMLSGDATIKYSAGDFKYRNFYLMKNEDLEAKDRDETDDVYASPMFNVVCPNVLLGKKQTVFQFPFSGAYTLNGDNQDVPTGNTVKYWDVSEYKASANAAAAALGLLYVRPVRTIAADGTEAYRGQRAISMEMWDTSMLENNASYRYLSTILENMISVKAKFRLDESDLAGLDYTRPVYLDKYSAYFALVSITVQNGISTVELIKLP